MNLCCSNGEAISCRCWIITFSTFLKQKKNLYPSDINSLTYENSKLLTGLFSNCVPRFIPPMDANISFEILLQVDKVAVDRFIMRIYLNCNQKCLNGFITCHIFIINLNPNVLLKVLREFLSNILFADDKKYKTNKTSYYINVNVNEFSRVAFKCLSECPGKMQTPWQCIVCLSTMFCLCFWNCFRPKIGATFSYKFATCKQK